MTTEDKTEILNAISNVSKQVAKNGKAIDLLTKKVRENGETIDGLAPMTHERFNRVESRLDRIEFRLDAVESRLDTLENRENKQDQYIAVHTDELRLVKTKLRIS